MEKLKTCALATLIACAMAACLGLVACSSGPTDEEVIKEGIASELDPIKNLDDATLDEILSEAGSEFAMLESMALTTPSIRSRSTATPQRRPLPQPANRSPTQAQRLKSLPKPLASR